MKRHGLFFLVWLLRGAVAAHARQDQDYLISPNAGGVSCAIEQYLGTNQFLSIPDTLDGLSVTIIGAGAFENSSITNVILPLSLTSIEDNAFEGCGIYNVTIPSSVTSIGDFAFKNCYLTNITIPAGVDSIGVCPFAECAEITAINVDSNNQHFVSVSGVLFDANQTLLIEFPLGLATFGNGKISYTIPASVSRIGAFAFAENAYLTSVSLSAGLQNIGDYAFKYCNGLTNAAIPASVTNIGAAPFDHCFNIAAITVDSNNADYVSSGGVLFDLDQSLLIEYPVSATATSYAIPVTVTSIGAAAFAGSDSLQSVTIPWSVTNLGACAFAQCHFLTNVSIPASVKTIAAGSFEDDINLAQVTISNGVMGIDQNAFYNCGLTTVTIPASVLSIQTNAFGDCEFLASINVDSNNPAYTSVGGVLFNHDQTQLILYPSDNRAKFYAVPSSVTSIADYAFYGSLRLNGVALPPSLASIGNYAFQFVPITNLTIPNSVTNLGIDAFENSGITNVVIGSGLSTIGASAFEGCNLNSVIIPANITTLGEGAFEFSYYLSAAYFLGNAPTADSSVFLEDNTKIYYLPGTSGWDQFFDNADVTTNFWTLPYPVILTSGSNFGVQSNQFGFTVSWATNISVGVQATTDLANPNWQTLQTSSLDSGVFNFSDPNWTNYSGRFYRLIAP